MKLIKKKNIEKRKKEMNEQTEKYFLVEMKHPFINQMLFSFENERKLFFVLEYCPGGELLNLL